MEQPDRNKKMILNGEVFYWCEKTNQFIAEDLLKKQEENNIKSDDNKESEGIIIIKKLPEKYKK